MRSAFILGARYLAPYVRRKLVTGIKGFLGSGSFVGKKNLDLFRPRMSKLMNPETKHTLSAVYSNARGGFRYRAKKRYRF